MYLLSIIGDFFKKTLLPLGIAFLIFCLFHDSFIVDGHWNSDALLGAWVICGFPFGFGKTPIHIVSYSNDYGATMAVTFVFSLLFAGFIGGFFVVGKLIVAVAYIPYTLVRLIAYMVGNRRHQTQMT